MKGRHKKFSNFTVISALFFSAFTLAFGNIYVGFSEENTKAILGIEAETTKDALEVTSNITDLQKNGDGTYSVDYEITLKNTSDKIVKNVALTNSFNNTFPNNDFVINSFSSDTLSFNKTYNGIDLSQMLSDSQNIDPNSTDKIKLSITFNPGENTGPFKNAVNASGFLDGTHVKSGDEDSESGDDSGEDLSDSDSTDNPVEDKEVEEKPEIPTEVEKNLEPRNIRLFIVDTVTGVDLIEILEGSLVNVSELTTNPISIRASVEPFSKGSVLFGLNSDKYYKIENNAPFSMSGNTGNSFNPLYIENGSHTLTVSAYTGKGANGLVIGKAMINFELSGNIPNPKEETESETSKEDESGTLVATSSQAISLFSLDEVEEDNNPFVPKQDVQVPVIDETPISTADDVAQVVQKNEIHEATEASQSGRVLSIAIAKDSSSGRVLAATGVNLSQVILIGMFIMIAVIELNMVRSEKNLFTKITHLPHAKNPSQN